MKTLCIAAAALVLLPASALAQENSITFKQTQGDDGLFHIDIGVSYVFPGLPPRTNNTGAGTVRITLPGSTVKSDPANPADAGYSCFPSTDGVTCSNDGQPNGAGLTFPTSVTIHLISSSCVQNQAGAQAAADVWAAPNDPGTPPDVTLPIDAGACAGDNVLQPVLDTKPLKCTVPRLKNVSLVSAIRRLNNAKCARGKVTYAASATVAKGHVISQSIKPGKVLKGGTKVNLLVSRGKKS